MLGIAAHSTRRTLGGLLVGALGLGLTACSSPTPGPSAPSGSTSASAGPVTITVQGPAAGAEQATVDNFTNTVTRFTKEHPTITVKPVEWKWDPTTFAAQLAGGQLPNQFTVPFTDGRQLAANKQVYDLSSLLTATDWAAKIAPNVAGPGQAPDGSQWMVPFEAYGIGLTYNRELFTQAGLDPDTPPTTWDEVRQAAKAITDKTGKPGYAQMSKDNAGGWMLTSFVNTLGSSTVSPDGATAQIDTPEVRKALQFLHDLKWVDKSMGENVLLNWDEINQAFSSGEAGMFMGGSDLYTAMATGNEMKPAIYGLTVLPQEGPNAGFLAGGALAAVSQASTPEQAKAALAWIEFSLVRPLLDKDAAIEAAKAGVADKQPVGVPGMPLLDKAQWDQTQAWIKPYVNVPLNQFQPYLDKVFTMKLVPEPSRHAQEVYGGLDALVQAVLTEQDADIDALAKEYQGRIQHVLDKK